MQGCRLAKTVDELRRSVSTLQVRSRSQEARVEKLANIVEPRVSSVAMELARPGMDIRRLKLLEEITAALSARVDLLEDARRGLEGMGPDKRFGQVGIGDAINLVESHVLRAESNLESRSKDLLFSLRLHEVEALRRTELHAKELEMSLDARHRQHASTTQSSDTDHSMLVQKLREQELQLTQLIKTHKTVADLDQHHRSSVAAVESWCEARLAENSTASYKRLGEAEKRLNADVGRQLDSELSSIRRLVDSRVCDVDVRAEQRLAATLATTMARTEQLQSVSTVYGRAASAREFGTLEARVESLDAGLVRQGQVCAEASTRLRSELRQARVDAARMEGALEARLDDLAGCDIPGRLSMPMVTRSSSPRVAQFRLNCCWGAQQEARMAAMIESIRACGEEQTRLAKHMSDMDASFAEAALRDPVVTSRLSAVERTLEKLRYESASLAESLARQQDSAHIVTRERISVDKHMEDVLSSLTTRQLRVERLTSEQESRITALASIRDGLGDQQHFALKRQICALEDEVERSKGAHASHALVERSLAESRVCALELSRLQARVESNETNMTRLGLRLQAEVVEATRQMSIGGECDGYVPVPHPPRLGQREDEGADQIGRSFLVKSCEASIAQLHDSLRNSEQRVDELLQRQARLDFEESDGHGLRLRRCETNLGELEIALRECERRIDELFHQRDSDAQVIERLTSHTHPNFESFHDSSQVLEQRFGALLAQLREELGIFHQTRMSGSQHLEASRVSVGHTLRDPGENTQDSEGRVASSFDSVEAVRNELVAEVDSLRHQLVTRLELFGASLEEAFDSLRGEVAECLDELEGRLEKLDEHISREVDDGLRNAGERLAAVEDITNVPSLLDRLLPAFDEVAREAATIEVRSLQNGWCQTAEYRFDCALQCLQALYAKVDLPSSGALVALQRASRPSGSSIVETDRAERSHLGCVESADANAFLGPPGGPGRSSAARCRPLLAGPRAEALLRRVGDVSVVESI